MARATSARGCPGVCQAGPGEWYRDSARKSGVSQLCLSRTWFFFWSIRWRFHVFCAPKKAGPHLSASWSTSLGLVEKNIYIYIHTYIYMIYIYMIYRWL
jgi:hypothetical protein